MFSKMFSKTALKNAWMFSNLKSSLLNEPWFRPILRWIPSNLETLSDQKNFAANCVTRSLSCTRGKGLFEKIFENSSGEWSVFTTIPNCKNSLICLSITADSKSINWSLVGWLKGGHPSRDECTGWCGVIVARVCRRPLYAHERRLNRHTISGLLVRRHDNVILGQSLDEPSHLHGQFCHGLLERC